MQTTKQPGGQEAGASPLRPAGLGEGEGGVMMAVVAANVVVPHAVHAVRPLDGGVPCGGGGDGACSGARGAAGYARVVQWCSKTSSHTALVVTRGDNSVPPDAADHEVINADAAGTGKVVYASAAVCDAHVPDARNAERAWPKGSPDDRVWVPVVGHIDGRPLVPLHGHLFMPFGRHHQNLALLRGCSGRGLSKLGPVLGPCCVC